MTLFPKNSDIQVSKHFNDPDGWVLILQIQKKDSNYVIGNVYAPTQDHPEDQIDLIDRIEEEITKMDPQDIIVGGDLNLCMDRSLDRAVQNHRGQQTEGDRYKARIEAFEESLHLVDLWRTLHPTTKHFSFRRAKSASRLDYWLTSEHLLDSKAASAIVPYPLSDHAAITIKVGSTPTPPGPGLWRMDNSYYRTKNSKKKYKTFLLQKRTTQRD